MTEVGTKILKGTIVYVNNNIEPEYSHSTGVVCGMRGIVCEDAIITTVYHVSILIMIDNHIRVLRPKEITVIGECVVELL